MKDIKRTKISDLLLLTSYGSEVNVKGWVRTRRGSKQVAFVALNDGSTIKNVQIVIDLEKIDEELVKKISTGTCLSVNGTLVESIGGGQSVEVQATEIEILGECDNTYPLQKKGQTMEFMRSVAHLRPRTNTFGAIFRIRHNMAYAILWRIRNTAPKVFVRGRRCATVRINSIVCPFFCKGYVLSQAPKSSISTACISTD